MVVDVFSLAATRQVDVSHEHIARIHRLPIARIGPSTAAPAQVPGVVVAIAWIATPARIVVQHEQLLRGRQSPGHSRSGDATAVVTKWGQTCAVLGGTQLPPPRKSGRKIRRNRLGWFRVAWSDHPPEPKAAGSNPAGRATPLRRRGRARQFLVLAQERYASREQVRILPGAPLFGSRGDKLGTIVWKIRDAGTAEARAPASSSPSNPLRNSSSVTFR
jgi:hypothetical protein